VGSGKDELGRSTAKEQEHRQTAIGLGPSSRAVVREQTSVLLVRCRSTHLMTSNTPARHLRCYGLLRRRATGDRSCFSDGPSATACYREGTACAISRRLSILPVVFDLASVQQLIPESALPWRVCQVCPGGQNPPFDNRAWVRLESTEPDSTPVLRHQSVPHGQLCRP
jgi:hypothetical protein